MVWYLLPYSPCTWYWSTPLGGGGTLGYLPSPYLLGTYLPVPSPLPPLVARYLVVWYLLPYSPSTWYYPTPLVLVGTHGYLPSPYLLGTGVVGYSPTYPWYLATWWYGTCYPTPPLPGTGLVYWVGEVPLGYLPSPYLLGTYLLPTYHLP